MNFKFLSIFWKIKPNNATSAENAPENVKII